MEDQVERPQRGKLVWRMSGDEGDAEFFFKVVGLCCFFSDDCFDNLLFFSLGWPGSAKIGCFKYLALTGAANGFLESI